MTQIQDSANYLKDACKCLDEIKGRPKKVSCDSEETEKVTKGPVEIRKAFEDLTESLRRAESALVLPQPVSALQIYNSEKKVHTLYKSIFEKRGGSVWYVFIGTAKTCIARGHPGSLPHQLSHVSPDSSNYHTHDQRPATHSNCHCKSVCLRRSHNRVFC